MFSFFGGTWKRQIQKVKTNKIVDESVLVKQPTFEPKTYLNISLEGDNVIIRSSCDNILVFFSFLKNLHPLLQNAALESVKDQTKYNLLKQMIKESNVVVRASQVFGDKK